MAFFSKVGNILKQSVSKQITSQFSATNPSIFQAIRCMSSSKLFIGGLPYAVDDTTLRETFSQYGEVVEARVIVDRESGRSRGFGFITYTSSEEANSAIQALDGQDLHGRRVRVNFAADRPPRQFGGGGGGFGGGGYGGGGFGGGGGGYGGGSYGGGGYGGSGGSYGGGGYSGGQNYGSDNSGGFGGAPAGGQYGGGSYGSGGGGYGSGGGNYGVAGGAGGGDSLFGGGSTSGSNATADTGFASSGFEQGSGLGYDDKNQVGSNASGAAANDGAGDYDPSEPVEGNIRDDETDDFAKRA